MEEEIAVKIQSSTERSFIWKDRAVFGYNQSLSSHDGIERIN